MLGQVLGTNQSTAQVHPEKLTKAMMAAAEERGAVVRLGTVQAVDVSDEPSPHVTGVPQDCLKTAVIGLIIVYNVEVDSEFSHMLNCCLVVDNEYSDHIINNDCLACLHDRKHHAVYVQ